MPTTRAESFYVDVMRILLKEKLPFMIGGTYAFREYTGIFRKTKDLDIFTKTSDYPKMLVALEKHGFKTEVTDARWLAKVKNKSHVIDIIFGSASGLALVDDTWLSFARTFAVFGIKVKLLAPEEVIWTKCYVQDRSRYEGSDIYHIILRQKGKLDWQRILMRMEAHWEILLAHLINFRFVYPSEVKIIPKWLMEELLSRINRQFSLSTPKDKVCRGPILSRRHYEVDVKEWGFRDIT